MAIGIDLRTYLLTLADLTALIGQRIYPADEVPSNPTFPLIAFSVISDESTHHLLGVTGIDRARVQLDILGDRYVEVQAVRDVIKSEVDGFRGQWDGSEILSCLKENDFDQTPATPPSDSSKTRIHQRVLDFVVGYRE